MCKKLKKNLVKANSLFRTTLDVKLNYEKVIAKLYSHPVTSAVTKEIIKTTSVKSKTIAGRQPKHI